MTYTCDNKSCEEPGHVTMDDNASNLVCGVRGVIEVFKSNFPCKGNIACESCGTVYYKDE